MKKLTVAISAVAASVLMAMSAQAAEIYNKDNNKLDLYGKVDAKRYFSSNDKKDGDTTYARLGFRGETQINNQLTGYGQWEYNLQANGPEDDGSNSATRLAFAGLKFGDYGSIDYGRNYGVAYDIGAWTDVLPEFGGDTWTQTDVFMTGRTTGVATYRNNDFFGLIDGLNFAAQYQGKNDRSDFDNYTEGNGDGFGFSTTYEYEGFGVGATYAKSDRTDTQVNAGKIYPEVTASGKHAEVWAAGLKYDANNIYLATTYSETQNMTVFGNNHIANKAQNFEAVAQYQFDFGLRPSVAYLQSKGKDLGVWGDKDLVKYIDVGATYYFNKNMSAFVDYKINLLDKNDFTGPLNINTKDIFAVGMVYQF
ncbi:porin [Escherichia coli]|uniref:porin n=1 Tax=Escherichia coli TaxID=562 RepID=UPI0016B4CE59|nr:porin [Escherichia coli]EFJ8857306.1 porin [Escherichia coli]EFJ9345292.1 porin [Escherichia coli]EFJ9375201.1 porin [Escherichia coli]EFJ9400177.1 porin [Escherichia coli]EFK0006660.1 porin [Escherichia coli]